MTGPISWQRLYILGMFSTIELGLAVYLLWGVKVLAVALLVTGAMDTATAWAGWYRYGKKS